MEIIPAADEDALKAYCTKTQTRVNGPFGFPSTLLRNRTSFHSTKPVPLAK